MNVYRMRWASMRVARRNSLSESSSLTWPISRRYSRTGSSAISAASSGAFGSASGSSSPSSSSCWTRLLSSGSTISSMARSKPDSPPPLSPSPRRRFPESPLRDPLPSEAEGPWIRLFLLPPGERLLVWAFWLPASPPLWTAINTGCGFRPVTCACPAFAERGPGCCEVGCAALQAADNSARAGRLPAGLLP